MEFSIPKKFKKLFRDGLSTPMSYLVLREWTGRKGNGYHAAIQPQIQRVNENQVFVGGKLRIAWDDWDDKESIDQLLEKFNHIGWARVSTQRMSVMFGQIYNASIYEGKSFFKDNPGSETLNNIEKLLKTKFPEKLNLLNAFNATLKLQIDRAFEDGDIDGAIEKAEGHLAKLVSIRDGELAEPAAETEAGVATDNNIVNLFG